jgi:hypothetical protein
VRLVDLGVERMGERAWKDEREEVGGRWLSVWNVFLEVTAVTLEFLR